MSKLQSIYRRLRQIPDPIIDLAMSDALTSAGREPTRLLVLSLLERGNQEALAGVIRIYHELDSDLQNIIVQRGVELDGCLRAVALSDDMQGKLNSIEVIVKSKSYRLVYLLGQQMTCDDSRVRRDAASGLLNLVSSIDHPQPVGHTKQLPLTQQRKIKWIEDALLQAAATYKRHQRKDIILAICGMAPRKLPELMKMIQHKRSSIHDAFVSQVIELKHPAMKNALLSYANEPGMEHIVIEAMRRYDITSSLPIIISQSHLMHIPLVRRIIARVVDPERLLPKHSQLSTWTPEQIAGLPRWITQLRVSEASKIKHLSELAGHQDSPVRFTALRQLIRIKSPESLGEIAVFCFDPIPEIARLALRTLIMRKWDGLNQLLPRLMHSQHDVVADLAKRTFLPASFELFWDKWSRLSAVVRKQMGTALLKVDEDFKRKLALKFSHGNHDVRLKAVMIARVLGIESYFENELLTLVDDEHVNVVSAAVAALGNIDAAPEIIDRLKGALDHADDRVRANAVESITQIQRVADAQAKLIEIAQSGQGNRSRANAIHALLKLPLGEALEALQGMLHDSEESHRISALWVVDVTQLFDIAQIVADMALADGSLKVRQSAGRSLRQLAHARRLAHVSELAAAADQPHELTFHAQSQHTGGAA